MCEIEFRYIRYYLEIYQKQIFQINRVVVLIDSFQ